MDTTFSCPRRLEAAMFAATNDEIADHIDACLRTGPHNPYKTDDWRDPDRVPARTCSYCGSIHPDDLFAALDAGTATLGPTDKNYKVYVTLPNPHAGERRIVGMSTGEPRGEGWVKIGRAERRELKRSGASDQMRSVMWGVHAPTVNAKLYTLHLDRENAARLRALINTGKAPVGPPGRFYNGLWLAPPVRAAA